MQKLNYQRVDNDEQRDAELAKHSLPYPARRKTRRQLKVLRSVMLGRYTTYAGVIDEPESGKLRQPARKADGRYLGIPDSHMSDREALAAWFAFYGKRKGGRGEKADRNKDRGRYIMVGNGLLNPTAKVEDVVLFGTTHSNRAMRRANAHYNRTQSAAKAPEGYVVNEIESRRALKHSKAEAVKRRIAKNKAKGLRKAANTRKVKAIAKAKAARDAT